MFAACALFILDELVLRFRFPVTLVGVTCAPSAIRAAAGGTPEAAAGVGALVVGAAREVAGGELGAPPAADLASSYDLVEERLVVDILGEVVAALLLEHGANPNAFDPVSGFYYIHLAAGAKHPSNV